jgi:DNA repair exonuclease SbcCD nuclease subunit
MIKFYGDQICCIADIHIGVHQNSAFWHKVTNDWAVWLCDELRKKKIKDIVISGDLFHFRDEIAVNTLHEASKILENFNDFNLIILCGNHDCFLKDSSEINSLQPFKKWQNITVIDTITTIQHNDKTIAFVPWGSKLVDIPKADIIFGHFEISSFKMNTHTVCVDGLKSSDLIEKGNIIFTGHFHNRDERFYDGKGIVYVGNPFQMDFSDATLVKGYYIIDVLTSTYKFTANKISPQHFNILLSELTKQGTITNNDKKHIYNNLIKLRIDRRISPEHAEILITKIKQYLPAQLIIDYDFTVNEYDLSSDKKDFSGIDIEQAITEFINLMDINNKSEIINYTINLYRNAK